jgi:hypothetical protein
MAKADLTAQRLREVLSYNPDTGEFRWLSSGKGRKSSLEAGAVAPDSGYVFICIDWQRHRAHRLAWLYVYGEWPKDQIDHINGVRADNRIANLRDVTNDINGQNRRAALSNNRSGYLGVSWKKSASRWIATISDGGKHKHLGSFATAEEAHTAYLAAKRVIHPGCVH